MSSFEIRDGEGNVVGPVAKDLVLRAIEAGRIPSDGFYREAGASDWLPIRSFPGQPSVPNTTQLILPAGDASPTREAEEVDGDLTLLLGADAVPKAPARVPLSAASPAAGGAGDPAKHYSSAYSLSTSLGSLGGLFYFGAVACLVVSLVVGLTVDVLAVKAVAVVGGVVTAIGFAALGLLWSAVGQLLRAVLDTAVNTRLLVNQASSPPRT